jgi:K+-sensing histidine kinase KdpD
MLGLLHGSPKSPIKQYGVATLSVAIALLLTMLIEPFLKTRIFALFYPIALINTLHGSWRTGLFSIVLSALVCNYFFQEPGYSLKLPDLDAWVRLIVFLGVTLLLC